MSLRQVFTSTRGRFFAVEFVKRDGSLRVMTARLGVRKHLTGAGLSYDPTAHNLLTVWDARKRAYRSINLETVSFFKCGETVVGRRGACDQKGLYDFKVNRNAPSLRSLPTLGRVLWLGPSRCFIAGEASGMEREGCTNRFSP